MFAEADDAHVAAEALEQVAHLVRLAEVVVLVHVEGLQVLATRKDERVVLVLGLALADDRRARQPHLGCAGRTGVSVGVRVRVKGERAGRSRQPYLVQDAALLLAALPYFLPRPSYLLPLPTCAHLVQDAVLLRPSPLHRRCHTEKDRVGVPISALVDVGDAQAVRVPVGRAR